MTPDMFMEYREGGRLDIWCQLLRLVDAARVSERFGWPLRELNWWKV